MEGGEIEFCWLLFSFQLGERGIGNGYVSGLWPVGAEGLRITLR